MTTTTIENASHDTEAQILAALGITIPDGTSNGGDRWGIRRGGVEIVQGGLMVTVTLIGFQVPQAVVESVLAAVAKDTSAEARITVDELVMGGEKP